MSTTTAPGKLRSENTSLQVTRNQRALIDRAANALGRSRSDFILEAACHEAESVLLDRRFFALSDADFKRFTAMLDAPPSSNPGLKRLLRTKASWEKSNRMVSSSLSRKS